MQIKYVFGLWISLVKRLLKVQDSSFYQINKMQVRYQSWLKFSEMYKDYFRERKYLPPMPWQNGKTWQESRTQQPFNN